MITLYGRELFGDERGVINGHAKEICSEEDDLAIMRKQIAARAGSPDQESLARRGPMRSPSLPMRTPTPIHSPSPERRATPTPPPFRSSVTPDPSPPPRLRRGSRQEPRRTHAVRDIDSPLTDLADNVHDKDDHTGHTSGPPQRPHKQAKTKPRASNSSIQDPGGSSAKRARKSHK